MANPPIHDHSYRQYLLDKKLMGSRCTGCGAQYVPPRDVCAACHEGAMEWVQMRGAGSLSAFTTISIGTPATVAEGYDRNNPYCCAVVALEGTNLEVGVAGAGFSADDTFDFGGNVLAGLLQDWQRFFGWSCGEWDRPARGEMLKCSCRRTP